LSPSSKKIWKSAPSLTNNRDPAGISTPSPAAPPKPMFDSPSTLS
jgi:hypothetical protein